MEAKIPNPANYTMKGNPPQTAPVAQAAPEMPDIDQLPAEALRDLVRRLFGAVYGIGLMNDEQTAEAMLLRLAIDGLQSRDARVSLANFNAWLDRKQGKPIQSTQSLVALADVTPELGENDRAALAHYFKVKAVIE